MTIATKPLIFSSKEELHENLDKIVQDFKGPGIAIIRGLTFTKEEQEDLTCDLGDRIGWFPNNRSVMSKWNHSYQEDHGHNAKTDVTTGEEIVLDWHLEHVDYDSYIPLVGGAWNMQLFKCGSDNGRTYFLDSQAAIKKFSSKEIEFLSKCVATWIDVDDSGPHHAQVITKHWLNNDPLIRIEITRGVKTSLLTFEGRVPTSGEQNFYDQMTKKFMDIIDTDLDLRIEHRWEEGDLVIVDLFRMAHAVTGGFNSKDRKFNGIWLFSKDPHKDGLTDDELPLVWRK